MSYPVKASPTLEPGQVFNQTFRPAVAGLVTAILVGTGKPPSQGSGGGDGGSGGNGGSGSNPSLTKALSFSLKLEIFNPSSSTAVAVQKGTAFLDIGPAILVCNVDAAAADLNGDWTARITNTSPGEPVIPVACDLTVRYQVVPGNLGKIDHVVILIQENRSFDHMLGYLRLNGGRNDIDGLTEGEANADDSGNSYPIAPLNAIFPNTPTDFPIDPRHGWSDVDEQLCRDPKPIVKPAPPGQPAPPPPGGGQLHFPNRGFVLNFEEQFSASPSLASVHDIGSIAAGGTRDIQFRPGQPGEISVTSVAASFSGIPGDLGSASLFLSGSNVSLTTSFGTVSQGEVDLTYMATAADLESAGYWKCTITNLTGVEILFSTTIEYRVPQAVFPSAIMGYYTKSELPVYDFFASQYAICNRWFASLPTDTWPNRLYALTGSSGGLINTPHNSDVVRNPPGYNIRSIFDMLQEQGVEWGVYFSDLPYCLVFRTVAQNAQYSARLRDINAFAALAKTGDLPSVSWIDPNFLDVPDGTKIATDDHPPGNVCRGQQFVANIYNLLCASPAWWRTLFIITYDEHGGFYDHVTPPGTPSSVGAPPAPGGPPDDDPSLERYGVRVPAFVISPWVQPGSVSNVVFDHTSMLATVLRRFCQGSDGTVPSLSTRTDKANDVGAVLSSDAALPGTPVAAIAQCPDPTTTLLQPDSFAGVLRKALFKF